jgi:hypothetical protein
MNTRGPIRHFISTFVIALAVIPLLLAACQPATVPPAPTLPPAQPTATRPPAPTQPAAKPTQTPAATTGEIAVNVAGVAQGQVSETIPAVPPSQDHPIWDILPEYHRLTLQGYPVTNHLLKPQVFVYPVAELAKYSEGAAKIAADLAVLLQSKQPADHLPFLPLFNATQVLHAQVQFLDFKNGKGVRFLTQFDQAPLPVNNRELFYTFQGLTKDGKYYVAAVLPVTHPDLPATDKLSAEDAAKLGDFPAYLTKTAAWLEQQPADQFSPGLAKLDALIQSIEVK